MTTFPALIPSTRTFTPGDYPNSPFTALSGLEGRVRHSNVMLGSRLTLGFRSISESDMLAILAHYQAQGGQYAPFPIPSSLLNGVSAAGDYTLEGYQWRYVNPPSVTDIPCAGYDVSIELESVPAVGVSVISTLQPTVQVLFTPGVAAAAASLGIEAAINITLDPGQPIVDGAIDGDDFTVNLAFADNGAAGNAFAAGGAFTVDVVFNDGIQEVSATGGDSVTDITVDGIDYRVHAFTTVGTSSLVVTAGGDIDYLVVAGGGGGGSRQGGGGGGAGGLLTGSMSITADTYTVTVGAGGAGGPNTAASDGTNGGNSVFGSLTAIGGGGGGRALNTSTETAGLNGGSGGGAGRSGTSTLGGTGTASQGNNGGANLGTNDGAGGGGGAGAAGQDRQSSPVSAGDGGAGLFVAAFAGFGDQGYFAGGGGGGSLAPSLTALSGAGGIGGGGDGAGQSGISSAGDGGNGMANTGGGGGGAQGDNAGNRAGGDGGSGVVLIRYRI